MFKHYLQTALRHFRQHKLTTSINVICLTLGLASFMGAWGVAAYYSKSDWYHERAARTYVMTTKPSDSGITMNVNPWLLGEHLRTSFPQIEYLARVTYPLEAALTSGGVNAFANVAYAEADFARIFDLPVLFGSKSEALASPRGAIVSKHFARRLFGVDDAVGKSFRFSGSQTEATVAAVVDDMRQPSHISTSDSSPVRLSFDVLLSMDLVAQSPTQHRWDDNAVFTYIVLPSDGTLTTESLIAQLPAFTERHVDAGVTVRPEFGVSPIASFVTVNLDSLVGADTTGVSSMLLLQVLGALVLFAACLNYANLATAQAATHAKEVAMQRVVGASRWQVMAQRFVEGGLLTIAALALSLLALIILVVVTAQESAGALILLITGTASFWWVLGALIVGVSLVAAAYPAFVLARVRPAQALRAAKIKGGSRLITTWLVGLQFGAASFLLIAVSVMAAQNRAMKQAVWDANDDPMVVIANDLRAARVDPKLLKQELARLPGVHAASALHRLPWSLGGNGEPFTLTDQPGAAQNPASYTIADADVFAALNVKLVAGRSFERDRAADVANIRAWNNNDTVAGSDYNVVVDELFVARMGLQLPQQAVGKTVFHPTSADGSTPPQRMHIVGVVEPNAIRPISLGYPSFYFMNEDAAIAPVVRIAKQDVAATLAHIDALWKRLAPEVPLKRRFADEQYEMSYQFLNIVNAVFISLAVFALIIATMGLTGMALHIVRRRTHEIGVRKTLGASVGQILWMLLKNFSKPVVIANLVVWPLVYVAMKGYLSIYAHQAGLTPTPFLLSFAFTLAIAWLAVSWQAARAARLNPATVLRYE